MLPLIRILRTCCAVALALLGLAGPAFAADPPPPRIVVLDKVAIMQYSKVGLDIARQVKILGEQAKRGLQTQSQAVQAEGRTLQQQQAILAPEAKQKRLDAFQTKEKALAAALQASDEQIQAGFSQAREAVERALGPILMQVMEAHGADIVLDRQSVIAARSSGYDITKEVIDRLDAKMPIYKVTLAAAKPAPAVRRDAD